MYLLAPRISTVHVSTSSPTQRWASNLLQAKLYSETQPSFVCPPPTILVIVFPDMIRQRKKWCSETVDYHKSARPNKILSRAMFSTFGTYACRKIWSLTWSCTNVYAAVYKVRYHGHVIPTCTRQSHLRNRGHVVPMFTGQSDIRKRDDVSICTRQTSEWLAVLSNHMWESDSEQQTIT